MLSEKDLDFLNDEWNVTFNKKNTDTLIQQTETKPQEVLDFKMNREMESFSFSPPKNMVEEGKWLLAVTVFEAMKSVFNTSDEHNSFSISTAWCWSSRGGA